MNFSFRNSQYKSCCLTSSIPGEGKSSVSINLARVLAENGSVFCSSTAIWEADAAPLPSCTAFSFQRIEHRTQREQHAGRKHCDLQWSSVWPDDSGTDSPNPTELFASAEMGNLLELLETRLWLHHRDTPPVPLVTDAAILSEYCDGGAAGSSPEICDLPAVSSGQSRIFRNACADSWLCTQPVRCFQKCQRVGGSAFIIIINTATKTCFRTGWCNDWFSHNIFCAGNRWWRKVFGGILALCWKWSRNRELTPIVLTPTISKERQSLDEFYNNGIRRMNSCGMQPSGKNFDKLSSGEQRVRF